MKRKKWIGFAVVLSSACAAPTVRPAAQVQPPQAEHAAHAAPTSGIASWAKGALLLPDLGSLHRGITTSSAEAQAYFDQGLRLNFGFNHDEAARSFARATELDPSCASCYWGLALVLGPNYNVPMLPDRAATAWEALNKAKALAEKATPTERALIGALSKRYRGPEPLEAPAMQPLQEAYASAMRDVARQFPDDLDVRVLFAEALMDTNPWKLWSLDGKPAPQTTEIVTELETVLKKDPQHPGANHYYIHTIEASPHPEKALPSAERLAGLMPGAGHVVHMPAHIFQRVGRYADASAANRKAVEVDLAYLKRTKPPGYYPMYLGHNHGFLAYSASMEGRAQESLQAARASAKAMPPEMVDMMPGMDFFVSEPILAMVRFSRWDELLVEPRPPEKFTVMTALWLHGHGMALVAKGRLDDARADHAALLAVRDKMPVDLTAGLNAARDVAMLAAKILEARIAEAQKAPNAIALWQEAVGLEDKLAYSEPADWFYPVRHFLGAALLTQKKYKEAEAVYLEDLRRNPENGWALSGLAQAARALDKKGEANLLKKRLAQAWSNADITAQGSLQ